MSSERNDVQALHARWQEAREVAAVLHESWAGLLRGKRLFLQSASSAGIKTAEANKHYAVLVRAAQKEYTEAFKDMCTLADEYMAAKLGTSKPRKGAK